MLDSPENVVVILAATGEYHKSLFDQSDWVPQATQNVKDLFLKFVDSRFLGIPADRIYLLFDPSVPLLYDTIQSALESEPDSLLFYYCGHGIPREETLLLPTATTTLAACDNSSIRADSLAAALDCNDCTVMLIIDACFSGKFFQALGTIEEVAESAVKEFEEPELVAFASASKGSFANSVHPDRNNSLFTGELLSVLETGLKDKGEYLTAADVFDATRKGIKKLGGPKPSVIGDPTQIRFTRNVARNSTFSGVSSAIRATFGDDTDARFGEAFADALAKATKTVAIVSMGFSLLGGHGHTLAKRLRDKVRLEPNLNLYCLLADPANLALKQRVAEELPLQVGGYSENWPAEFIKFCRNELHVGLLKTERARIHVDVLTYFPMTTVLQFDDTFFIRPYGDPSLQGRHSPWLQLDGANTGDSWVQFARKFVEFALINRAGNDTA